MSSYIHNLSLFISYLREITCEQNLVFTLSISRCDSINNESIMPSFPTYNTAQCHAIYNRIALPTHHRHEPGTASRSAARSAENGLPYLTALQQAALLHVPFENLELHYSHHKTISANPAVIYDKIITQDTGRGGYCMENNMLFATFLRSLGFDIYMTGAKVSDAEQPTSNDEGAGPGFTGFGHQVTIVTIGGERYLVDVGFGNGGPTRPLLLKHGAESERLPPKQKARMVFVPRPGAENVEAAKVWMYERTLPGKEDEGWLPAYCFPEGFEFAMEDFDVMNHFTSTARRSFFTYSVICSKFVAEDGKEDEGIVGHVTLFGNKVKVERKGKKETVAELSTEKERVKVLEEWLSVRLSETQKKGIQGMVTALAP